jgi:hypothetical protein
MHVTITKSSKDTYWYADKIGSSFEVTGFQEDIYEVRKWTRFPIEYDTAPVLKEDCKEIHGKPSPIEVRRGTDWRMKTYHVEKRDKLEERSGFKMTSEINLYEKLNKESAIKEYKDGDS